MSLREEQCKKVCRILDDVLANRPTERDSLIVAVRKAFKALEEPHWIPVTERLPDVWANILFCDIDGDVYAGHRTRHGDFYPDFDGDKIKNVVAWMPMPAPWKGE